jgi:flagellar biosynthesis protein FlhG
LKKLNEDPTLSTLDASLKNLLWDSAQNSTDIALPLATQRNYRIWAVGGGKGGVGKSLVTANLSICLALLGYRVVAIDLDLGGANLHTCLGLPIPERTLSDYITKKYRSLAEIKTPTPIPNLSIISGAQDELGITNLKNLQNRKILSSLGELEADIVILDLGAGTANNTLDFFIAADQGILTSLPEPTSLENTYRFIKAFFHRRLKMIDELLEFGPLIDKTYNAKINENELPADLVKRVFAINPQLGIKLKNEIDKISPKLIINQIRTQTDIDIGHSMGIICKKYFGINLDYVGHLEYDAAVWQSVKKRRPLLIEFPHSKLVANFESIVQKLLDVN